jgi:RNA polymerase sigma factor (sigma-70 family)
VRRTGATPAQLEALYRERFEHFSRVAAAICGDADLGRDAVQAAFATAVRGRRTFRGSGKLEAWVWRIVVNEARRLAREPYPMPLESASELSANGQGDDPLGVRAWISTLPERQREALFLRYYADLEYRAIADLLGIEVGTVSATLSAAHQALRKRLEEARR